ncbi:hypothetical protein WMY93_022359 [Mugilogobius chulae]|uniref:C-type lectin domain-containing protein n=1 Tax=Mugilogobius chulae TaxID=88201 RepID=A0AAW0NHY6_9GOBI
MAYCRTDILIIWFRLLRCSVVTEKKTWIEALEYCRSNHSDLASVASDREMSLIWRELSWRYRAGTYVWIGLRFLAGDWHWVDGQSLEFEAWGEGGKPWCPEKTSGCGALKWNVSNGNVEKKTWIEALEYCRSNHADLASVASDGEMALIWKALSLQNMTAACLDWAAFLAGDWHWVDGQPLEFEAWGDGVTSWKYVNVPIPMSWHLAQLYCEINYTDLAPITQLYCTTNYTDLAPVSNQRDRDDLHDLCAYKCWIGLMRNPVNPDVWEWSGGANVSANFWGEGEPNGRNSGENVAIMNKGEWYVSLPSLPHPFFCYKVHAVRQRKTWYEALDYCRQNHQDLASVASETELMLMGKELRKELSTQNIWIGLQFLAGEWVWVDGQTFSFESWGPNPKPTCRSIDYSCGAIKVSGVNQRVGRDVLLNVTGVYGGMPFIATGNSISLLLSQIITFDPFHAAVKSNMELETNITISQDKIKSKCPQNQDKKTQDQHKTRFKHPREQDKTESK